MTISRLPTGAERESLRQTGQFWTPNWIADAMVAYVLRPGCVSLFDPAVGAGAFFRAARRMARKTGNSVPRLEGTEIDPLTLAEARASGVSESDLGAVEIRDFVLDAPRGPFPAVVANPPYIRHHRIPALVKAELRTLGKAILGRPLDGRAGLHVYFLLRALPLLARRGRLAFIVPSDTCEGVFASQLWDWITAHYRLRGVVTFAPDATPFPGVDTNPVILFIQNEAPVEHFLWAKCTKAESGDLTSWTLSGLRGRRYETLEVRKVRVREALAMGVSREPWAAQAGRRILGEFAKVRRGIATGANQFFFLTASRARELAIPSEFVIPAVGRTRDVPTDELDDATMAAIAAKGRPTLLLALDGRAVTDFPAAVRRYLREGASAGVPRGSLIRCRNPWYKMEVRQPPPFLFAYLGRRNARFIRNRAGVVPLTGFLCVYPESDMADDVEPLWATLKDPRTVQNLALVGKSYGNGAIKVEPRALERLPLPDAVVADTGLEAASPTCSDRVSDPRETTEAPRGEVPRPGSHVSPQGQPEAGGSGG